MQSNPFIAACIFIGLIVISCNRDKNKNAFPADDSDAFVSLALTSKLMKNLTIETVRIEKQLVERYVECTGKLDLPPSAYMRIPVPVGGILNALYVKTGDYVKSGTLLADLEHPDYLNIQQAELTVDHCTDK